MRVYGRSERPRRRWQATTSLVFPPRLSLILRCPTTLTFRDRQKFCAKYISMDASGSASVAADKQTGTNEVEVDPIWVSSRTARQIYALGEVEKVRVITFLVNVTR